jgi:hypothetical protein
MTINISEWANNAVLLKVEEKVSAKVKEQNHFSATTF